ncbi:MAG: hypothetical protein DCC55_10445 [Chloroflexi bacterium]|nr:MAG: hypothetical protein DCC55_10445 [Chloroflexota bacterium]
MTTVPQIVPVSDMRLRHTDVLKLLENGIVVLAQRSKPAAVLVSVEEWNRLMEQLELLEDAVEIYKGRLAIATGKAETHRFSPEELAEWANEPEPVLG